MPEDLRGEDCALEDEIEILGCHFAEARGACFRSLIMRLLIRFLGSWVDGLALALAMLAPYSVRRLFLDGRQVMTSQCHL